MTFLAPGALIGLLLLAIPIIVHLFKPRRVRQTPFSSLRWLHLTQQRMARRIQWHQVLLFLLRAAFLVLLVLALTRPLLAPKGTAGSRDRVLVLDVSRSMGRTVEGRVRPIDAARDLAIKLFQQMQPGDRTAVLLTGADTTVLAPWTTDVAAYLPPLEALQAGPTATNLDSSLETLRALLNQRRPDAAVEICLVSDNASGSWTSGAISSFVADLPKEGEFALRLVDVGLPAPRNGWVSAARLRQAETGLVLHVEASCVGESAQNRTLHVSGLAGVQELSRVISLEPGRAASVDLPLPAGFDPAQSRVQLKLDPPDEMPEDDIYFVDLGNMGTARLLLVESDVPDDDTLRPAFPLRTALKALAEAGSSAADFQTIVRAPAAVTADDIGTADVIILADVPGLTTAQSEALSARVRAGAGLAIFLGPAVQSANYNQQFVTPLDAAGGLLPAALGGAVQVSASRGGLAAWGHWDARHPLVAGLLDPLLGDLGLVRSRAYMRFQEKLPAGDEVPAAFDDGTPALLARRVGAGRVVLFNASADDRWCDLPRRKSFVPLVDRLLTYLSTTGGKRSFDSGVPVALPLPADHAGDRIVVKTPTGNTLASRVETISGTPILRLEAPAEVGFYNVDYGGANAKSGAEAGLTFVVQPSRAESPLQTLDADTLRAWWSPARLDIVKPSTFEAALNAADGRVALEPWLALLAGLVLAAEMFLVHWLCPRINPALTSSIVRRRGFVPPLRSRENVAP